MATSIDQIIPTDDLTVAVRYAVLGELAIEQRAVRDSGVSQGSMSFYGVVPPVTRTLDWLIWHQPSRAAAAIGEIVGDAHRHFDVPRDVTLNSLRTALPWTASSTKTPTASSSRVRPN